MEKNELFPGDICRECGKGKLFDPDSKESPILPPTGGDYDWAETSIVLICDRCKTKFDTIIKRRYRLGSGKIEYINPYKF